MRFPSKINGKILKPSPLQPVLALVPEVLPTKEQDRSKFITFELKVRAGTPANANTYKKYVRVFEEGTPQQWIDLLLDLEEIWTQNGVNGPADRTATIRSLVKGESKTAFEVALQDARTEQEQGELEPLNLDHIRQALDAVATAVFPHRALEIQKLWINRGMKKPYDINTRTMASAITRINNCLPLFPTGTDEAKFSENKLVGLLEWSLPQAWRKKFDLDGYIPTLGTKGKLILECEAIERNESIKEQEQKEDSNNNKNIKKNKFGKLEKNGGKLTRKDNGRFFCSNCGRNGTHATPQCYFLKNKTQRSENKNSDNENNGHKNARPFSRRTFRKEVNTLARRAGKKKALGLYASALKREQAKESRKEKKLKIRSRTIPRLKIPGQ